MASERFSPRGRPTALSSSRRDDESLRVPGPAHRRLRGLRPELHRDPGRADPRARRPAPGRGPPLARAAHPAEPLLRAGPVGGRPRRRRRPSFPLREGLPPRKGPRRSEGRGAAAPPPPPPGRGDPHGPQGRELRPDDRDGLRQEPRVHRPHRRPRPPARERQGNPGDRRLPDERAGEQPGRGAPEVRLRGIPERCRAGDLRALHGAGVGRGPPEDPRQPARHPPDELRHARAAPHAAVRAEAHRRRAGAPVPRPRRASHLPRAAGGRRRPPRPPRSRPDGGRRAPVRRHVRHARRRRDVGRAGRRGRAGRLAPLRDDRPTRLGHRGDPAARHQAAP